MIPVRYHPAARQELRDAVHRGESERPGRGALLEAGVFHLLRRIRRLPRSAPRWPGLRGPAEVRRVVVKRHPYLVVYAILPEQIVVIAVAHMRQMPGYWQDRLATLPPVA